MPDASRRALLRGRLRPKAEIRPPWARPEAEFIDRCNRCNDCLKACPPAILVTGEGGYPTVSFAATGCTFCAECVTACLSSALWRGEGALPWTYAALAGPACLPRQGVECRVCGDFCEAGAIRFPPRLGGSPLPEIDSEKCTGCGSCIAPCPVGALSLRP